MYDVSAAFVFQPSSTSGGTEGGKMQLVGGGEDGVVGLDMSQMIQHWIVDRTSIPCFLASLTLECFEKTVGQGMGWVESNE
jgi:mitotic spindle assembly checkpoint protein MAD1